MKGQRRSVSPGGINDPSIVAGMSSVRLGAMLDGGLPCAAGETQAGVSQRWSLS